MPYYEFCNKKTKKIHTNGLMTISEMEEYISKHPELDVVPGAPPIGDPIRLGRQKPSEGFRDILRNVKRRNKGSTVNTFVIGTLLLNSSVAIWSIMHVWFHLPLV